MPRALPLPVPEPLTPQPIEPAKPKRWTPRASAIGGYFACDYRAALDRLAHEGLVNKPTDTFSPYAAHGTIIHYILQTGLGARFPRDAPSEHTPEPAEYISAASLFRGDLTAQQVAAQKAADLARRHLPTVEGRWWAESEFKTRKLTGHADLIAENLEDLVDLKTTSRKPDHNRMKPEHYIQLMAYKRMCPSLKRGHILYVDSMQARWAMLISFSFESAESIEFLGQLDSYLNHLTSRRLEQRCVPRMGAHCASGFCPWTELCRDKYIPPPGTPVEAVQTLAPTRSSTSIFDIPASETNHAS